MFDLVIRVLNALLMISVPLILGVFLVRRLGTPWRMFGIGAVTFVASQVFHIPFNFLALNPALEKFGLSITQSGMQLVIVALLYGLSAGIFEEVARYLVYRFRLKAEGDRTWSSALMFGAGHGGIEAIILGVLSAFAFVQMITFRDADLSTLVPADQLELAIERVEAYWALPWYGALLGAIERVIAICFHLSATVLVLQAFKRKNILWLGAAIIWHTLLDAVAVFGMQTWNMYVTEALIGVLGIASLGIIFLLREPPKIQDLPLPEVWIDQQSEIQLVEPSVENLEDSRYV